MSNNKVVINLSSEENILRSQGKYVPRVQKIKKFFPYAIIAMILAALIIFWQVESRNQQKIDRDVKRISDIRALQTAFESLFRKTYSYDHASFLGCGTVGDLVNQCNLDAELPTIDQFKDPGKFSYTVTSPPKDQSYEITFYLEQDYGSMKAGKRILDQNGIH